MFWSLRRKSAAPFFNEFETTLRLNMIFAFAAGVRIGQVFSRTNLFRPKLDFPQFPFRIGGDSIFHSYAQPTGSENIFRDLVTDFSTGSLIGLLDALKA